MGARGGSAFCMAGAPRSDARTPPRAQGVTADHLPPPPTFREALLPAGSKAEQNGVFLLAPTWLSLQSSPGGTAARAAPPAGGGSPGCTPHPERSAGPPKGSVPTRPGCSGGRGERQRGCRGRSIAAWRLRGRLLAKAQPGNAAKERPRVRLPPGNGGGAGTLRAGGRAPKEA